MLTTSIQQLTHDVTSQVGARNFDGVRWIKMFKRAKGFMNHPLAPDRTALDLLFARHKTTNKYILLVPKLLTSSYPYLTGKFSNLLVWQRSQFIENKTSSPYQTPSRYCPDLHLLLRRRRNLTYKQFVKAMKEISLKMYSEVDAC